MKYRNGLFVTATDTGVGKTLVSSALAAALTKRGLRVGIMKPVETGCPPRRDQDGLAVDGMPAPVDKGAADALAKLEAIAGSPAVTVSTKTPPQSLVPQDAEKLMRFARFDAPIDRINPYRYSPAVAPAVAARLAEREVDSQHILDTLAKTCAACDIVIVEGAGGVLVPLDDTTLIIDLIAATKFPAVVVAPSQLGTINHTLLTVEALRQRNIEVAGIVLNRLVRRPSVEEAANPLEIERFAGPLVRGVMPYFDEQQRQDETHLAQRCEAHIDVDALIADRCATKE